MSVMRQMPTLGKSFSMRFPPKSYLGPGKQFLVMWAEGYKGSTRVPHPFTLGLHAFQPHKGPRAEEAPNPLRFRV